MQITKVPLNKLISPDWNPRQITEEELAKLETSLNEFGYIEPIIVNDVNNHIVGGNQRLRALQQLGYDEIDVIYVHIEDLNKEKACNIALNKISGDWDNDKLKVVLEEIELSPINVSLTGFDEIELTEMKITSNEVTEDDYEEPDDLEVTVQQGDIYQLGKHRLMCGDSTKEEDVAELMNGEKADMVFTDPPYDFTECNYHKNIEKFTENAHIFIMNDDVNMLRYLRKSQLIFKQFFIANFGFASPRGDDPYLQHILISHEKNGDAKKPQNLHDSFRSIIKMDYRGRLKDDLTTHKHQKSIEFISKFLTHYATNDVLDLFGGSGSTLIACEQLNLNCYMMELDPKYCQIIINRWEQYTGRKAEKINPHF